MKKIWITFSKHGLHKYPNAPVEVGYLANEHRHLFKFKVTIEVSHLDRELEFHMVQNYCEGMYSCGVLELSNKSCEMLAVELLDKLHKKYTYFPNSEDFRYLEVEVSEDGECGAICDVTDLLRKTLE